MKNNKLTKKQESKIIKKAIKNNKGLAAFTNYTKSIKKAIELENSNQAKISQVNEISIRSQKVSKKFQRYCIVVSMLKGGYDRSEILDRLMSEKGIYAGVNKAHSEKSTKNFIGKVTSCYNGLIGIAKPGKVLDEMTRLQNGLDVTATCTFKSYAELTYKASL